MTKEEYAEKEHIIQRVSTELPSTVHAVTYHDDDGTEIVLVNVLLSPMAQHRSADHELRHIQRGDGWNAAYIEYAT